ncbi:MAG: two-component system, OmpR family, sensor kinase [Solirubrobacteraceae bacterium]|nr:two-component system, OmpR family, sensor kinase [Solirubrobacteraceae bacterium]
MSLRGRLIIGVVALAAVGLLVLGAATYGALSDFQANRVDGRAEASVGPALRALGTELGDHALLAAAARSDLGGGPGDSAPRGGRARGLGGPGGPDGPRSHGDGRRAADLPSAGTYVQQRDASGKVRGGTFLVPQGETQPAGPQLPSKLALNGHQTITSRGMDYRVYALPTPTLASQTTVIAIPFAEADATLDRLLLAEGLVIAAVLAALGAAAWWIVGLGLRPLDRIGATAGAIAAGDLSRRVEPAEPRTEVGRLGLSLNAMLARLEEAFAERRASEDRLRRFLADASHELRTPLASIRGYAELFRIGAATEPADLEKAMTRIEDESARMGVLIEDLLALARLDEVREHHREPVNLVALAGDAVDDARVVAPERTIELHDGAGAMVVDGDPSQLRQVLANLMRNALMHTPAGTAIDVSLARNDGAATLAVRDHGEGLPSGDPNELFDRFWRADPARGRGRAGAGLGLAIVARIVAAHGGRAEAADAEGGGARFTVTLPLRPGGGARTDG